jgi:hypothetical protein
MDSCTEKADNYEFENLNALCDNCEERSLGSNIQII